ncbi:MAG: aminotransferase class I/II-fold pyridoxal phosphate-dependent enzyme [Alphaproteobacteria bacterium]|jgi:histidinol-phosphate/aromatic aminotransferase/cobyric acid decarboxylase-like protein|nr:aminotransferase class I/II-fold pyridoxal phosphate-dependent enzyme [Alphaproteobacteria bacterium]|tara:strand:+ start:522 stop:881 length:360 start_codon:yes stop_codon:yes gene_type:complete
MNPKPNPLPLQVALIEQRIRAHGRMNNRVFAVLADVGVGYGVYFALAVHGPSFHIAACDSYRVDASAFAAALSANTRLVSLATPQNPSGVAISRAECEAVLALMGEVCPDAYLVPIEIF